MIYRTNTTTVQTEQLMEVSAFAEISNLTILPKQLHSKFLLIFRKDQLELLRKPIIVTAYSELRIAFNSKRLLH